jgi:hypothetical protein
MNYYKETPDQEAQIKYIPVYRDESDNNSGRKSNNNNNYQEQTRNPYNRDNVKVDVKNINDGLDGPGGYGPGGYGPGGFGPGGFGPGLPPVDPLRRFDYDAVEDDFTPPFRRSYYDDYNYRLTPGLYPTYTRGPPGRFRKVGSLIAQGVSANDKYKFLLLMGREKYPGREYEYFATCSNSEQKMKFYIETRGKEICDGDIVSIHELEGYSFKFKEDHDLSPKYDPYYV